jgi:hypothetical protein
VSTDLEEFRIFGNSAEIQTCLPSGRIVLYLQFELTYSSGTLSEFSVSMSEGDGVGAHVMVLMSSPL